MATREEDRTRDRERGVAPQLVDGTGGAVWPSVAAVVAFASPGASTAHGNSTGATAGAPGSWTPADSTPPANAAEATSRGVTASPSTGWTTGQYVQGSTAGAGGEMNWSGTAWVAGKHA